MKLPLVCCLFFFHLAAKSQQPYWSVSLSYAITGSPRELKKSFENAGFNNSTTVLFSQSFPRASRYPSVALEAGWFLRDKVSLSITAGLQEAGIVKGYNTNKGGLEIGFTNWFVNPMLNFHPHGAKLGLGPSAVLVNYKLKNYPSIDYHHQKLLPGLNLTAETVSAKKKGFRMGLFASLHLHPSFRIEPVIIKNAYNDFTFNSPFNPSSLDLGFRFRLH